jgi:predicted flavoprotein YhiN
MSNADVIIVGAGAAGLMCAIEAGKRGRSVFVIERNTSPGEKIRISGGGRCNFTNANTQPENFLSGNASFHKSALSRYKPEAIPGRRARRACSARITLTRSGSG